MFVSKVGGTQSLVGDDEETFLSWMEYTDYGTPS